MARPKSNLPRKQHLNLSVDAQARENLIFISAYHQKSMSLIISEWAAKEAARIAKKMGVSAPNANQISFENIIAAPLQPERSEPPKSAGAAPLQPERSEPPKSAGAAPLQPERSEPPKSAGAAWMRPEMPTGAAPLRPEMPKSARDARMQPEPRSLSGAIRKLMDKK